MTIPKIFHWVSSKDNRGIVIFRTAYDNSNYDNSNFEVEVSDRSIKKPENYHTNYVVDH